MAAQEPQKAQQKLGQETDFNPAANDCLLQYGITASYLEGGVGLSGVFPEGGRKLVLAVMAEVRQNPSKFVDDARLAFDLAVNKVAAQNVSWQVESTFN